jgi:amino acid transporter
VAFFAWVGLGADGLSSCCYGPEESFLALKSHMFLGIFVALATAATIFIISASYSQIIEIFPAGGGGYLVASKLLSPSAGMVSGCALIIDYVLTIALSISSGADAIFSFLPHTLYPYKMAFALVAVVALTALNLRGIKESVAPLIPVFLIFIATHVFAIIYAIATHLSDFGALASTTSMDIRATSSEIGMAGMLMLMMRAYSMGAGTYTGIEAVSNGMPILREPRIKTAKKTMRYMAISLAFMATGLMIGYLLYKVHPQPGKTLNAVLMESLVVGWNSEIGRAFLFITLASEALLLFIAAQTGFLDAPRVLASMAKDRWFPFQFALLSERFVTENGILMMGGSAFILILLSHGSVKFLVVLYSINVFITFFLSQLGMVRHWWKARGQAHGWIRKICVNGVGLVLTAFILTTILILKFGEGGWITVFITGSLVAFAIITKRFYYSTRKQLAHLDKLVRAAESQKVERPAIMPEYDPAARTAVIMVNGFNGVGLHTLLNVMRLFGKSFRNYFFVQAGIVDSERFKGAEELGKLQDHVKIELQRYVKLMSGQGIYAEAFSTIGTDVAEELSGLAKKIFELHPESVFFGGQIVFPRETIFGKFLYNYTSFAVQRRLHQNGIPFIIMPIRVGEDTETAEFS